MTDNLFKYHDQNWNVGSFGIELRDYFAVRAMQSLIIRRGGKELGALEKDEVSQESYILADAMLEAREQQ